ncbi:MAG: phosphatase PAP2 family protein [Aliidongia sp.]
MAVTPTRLWLAALLVAVMSFSLFPGLDLWFSGLFWTPDSGFVLRDWPPFHWAYAILPGLTWAIVLVLLALLAFVILAERPVGRFDRARIMFLLLSFALGPGLLTNIVLKDHWGRARPHQVIEFGGERVFTPPLVPADQCNRNCSFVSGHGAMAFSLIGFAFLPTTARRRRQLGAATLAFGGFVGLARIAQGGHFLSDTIFAALLVTGVAWLVHRIVVDYRGLDRPFIRRAARKVFLGAHWIGRRFVAFAGGRRSRWLAFNLGCGLAIAASVIWLDRPLARYFHAEDDRLTGWFRQITDLGLGTGWLVASGGLALLLLALGRAPRFAGQRERFVAWAVMPAFVFSAVALSGLAADLVKILVGRTRPKLYFADDSFALTGLAFRADHWSFPSGHTANVTALALALYFLWPRHAVAYALFVALIALSRIGTAQHFLSDTIGSVWLAVLVTFYLRGVLLRSGITLADAKAGIIPPRPAVPWMRRLLPRPGDSP